MSDDIECHFCGAQDFWCGTTESSDLWVRSKTCMSNEITVLAGRLDALKAERTGMVTREVALEAAIHAWSHGRLRFAGGGYPQFKLNPQHIWKEGVGTPGSNEREYREACECAAVVLARAELAALKAERATMVPREVAQRACRLSYNVAANRYHGRPSSGVSDHDQPDFDELIELSSRVTRLLDGEERDIAACLARAEAERATMVTRNTALYALESMREDAGESLCCGMRTRPVEDYLMEAEEETKEP